MNTKISYLYRDADNYKRYNECIVAGTLSAKQICTILDCCDMASIVKAEMTNERVPTPEIPQTGDSSGLTLWLGLGGIALGGLAACGILYFKRKKDEK